MKRNQINLAHANPTVAQTYEQIHRMVDSADRQTAVLAGIYKRTTILLFAFGILTGLFGLVLVP